MSIDILLTSFVMIFLLEIGDKTQLLVFGITSRNPHSKVPILLGFVMGIAAVTVIGAIVGEATRNLLPTEFLIVLSGLCFIGIGAYSFVGIYREWKQKNGRDETEIDQGREESEE
ncbi:MAG TPA: TMEM165/GDT1 family protein, partial [Candidatus Hodarchaeales archaeon]|nr:TMEM165/GDT1 family protein [Candidatus Hodarchaeales archaeon]